MLKSKPEDPKPQLLEEVRLQGGMLVDLCDLEFKLSGEKIVKPTYAFPVKFLEDPKSLTLEELAQEKEKIEKITKAYDQEIFLKRSQEMKLIKLEIEKKQKEALATLEECDANTEIRKIWSAITLVSEASQYYQDAVGEMAILGHNVYLSTLGQAETSALEQRLVQMLKDGQGENYSTLLVAQSLFKSPGVKYEDLSQAELETTQEQAKKKLLIKVPGATTGGIRIATGAYRRIPFGSEIFRVPNSEDCFIISVGALEHFGNLEMDHLYLQDVNPAELEALLVLYGGAAYPRFEDAQKAAKALI